MEGRGKKRVNVDRDACIVETPSLKEKLKDIEYPIQDTDTAIKYIFQSIQEYADEISLNYADKEIEFDLTKFPTESVPILLSAFDVFNQTLYMKHVIIEGFTTRLFGNWEKYEDVLPKLVELPEYYDGTGENSPETTHVHMVFSCRRFLFMGNDAPPEWEDLCLFQIDGQNTIKVGPPVAEVFSDPPETEEYLTEEEMALITNEGEPE